MASWGGMLGGAFLGLLFGDGTSSGVTQDGQTIEGSSNAKNVE